MAPKKTMKMDLGSFLADDTLGGSWADEEIDMASIGVPMSTAAPISNRRTAESTGFGARDGGMEPRREQRERQEYPIPENGPYRARVGNLAWEASEDSLIEFFEVKLRATGIVSDVKLPVDNQTGRLRGFGFLTFASRTNLEEALNLSFSDFNGRKIFVDVAAPEKVDVFDMDWRGSRGQQAGGRGDRGDRGDRPPRREEPDLDWGSARGSGVLPPREPRGDRGDRGDRPPRREEPQLDWGSARGTGVLPPREPREHRGEPREPRVRKDEPQLDWGSARGTGVLPPREPREHRGEPREPRVRKDEPQLDWGSARGSGVLPPRERSNRQAPKKAEPEHDWKRGQALQPRAPKANSQKKSGEEEKKVAGPQKSVYDVLSIDDEEEEAAVESVEQNQEETGLENATAKLSVEESKDSGDWEVVGK